MKRFFMPLLMLAIIVVTCMILNPAKALAASTSDLTFTLNDDGESYSVTDCDESAVGALSIPSTYNGKPVTVIDDGAFIWCSSLTSIHIPNSVTAIGNGAFSWCSSLTSINIPNSVTTIGDWAFSPCTSLTSITFPDNIISFGEDVFSCTVKNVYIADIAAWNKIGFTMISDFSAFDLYLNGELVTELIIPQDITTIGYYAFSGCTSLTSVTISQDVTEIGIRAFSGCPNLTSVTIPYSVTTINYGAFSGCESLTDVYFVGTQAQWDAIAIDGENEDLQNARLHFIDPCANGHTEEIIPGKAATYTETGLTEGKKCSICDKILVPQETIPVLPPESALTFTLNDDGESYSVTDCDKSAVGALSIPSTYNEKPVTTIGDRAFYRCTSLTSITIPNSVTTIGNYVFYGCNSLTTITIGNSVTAIDNYVFDGCDNLLAIWVAQDNPSFTSDSTGILCNKDKTELIRVPQGISGIYTISDSVTTIGDYAFKNCDKLTNIILPNSVTTISWNAFCDCTNLESINIPNSVTSIGGLAFYYCTNLKNVTIPSSITSIGGSVFYECTGLTSISIPYSVTSIGWHAFYNCSNLTDVYFVGTQAQWDAIAIDDDGNEYLQNATLHFIDPCANGHTEEIIPGKAATCTKTGLTKGKKCAACGQILAKQEKIPVTDHTYQAGICTVCKYAFPLNLTAYNRSATVIKTSGANIWSRPYTSGTSTLIRTASFDSKLTVVGYANNASGSLWYKLSDGNWVYATNIRVTDYNPADMKAISKTIVVTSWGANIWSKPYSSGDSKVAYSVEKTAALKIVAQVRNSTGGLWYKVSGGGWIYSKNVNEQIFDPADVIAYKRSATVIVPGAVNIWGQPSTKAPSTLTRTAAYQTKLNVVAKYTSPTGDLWYQLTDGNWVYSGNIRVTDYSTADVKTYNKTVVVTSWGANVWSKPYSSGDSKVVKTVAKSANVKVKAQVRNSTYGLWYQLADGSGWVYSQNVAVK